ncbi:hypothetical protein Pla108_04980 [Botrimarina colliarenosi]|uniref:Uncharacterized protein n=1 Tax=Botrimarina colliarenosi TaxID=2528001 RepID=A0A5C6AK65_9BACT|nr:hypothetical protein [Botrimarina colliarenosi]TWT99555.1 hypothetical protein Pla108_04980 [Botrimarina colliarenosi]
MRFGISDLLALLCIVAITLGTVAAINQVRDGRPVYLPTVVLCALMAISFHLFPKWLEAKDANALPNDSPPPAEWPILEYVTLGVLTVACVLVTINTEVRVDVGLGMACGYAIASTVLRHRSPPNG